MGPERNSAIPASAAPAGAKPARSSRAGTGREKNSEQSPTVPGEKASYFSCRPDTSLPRDGRGLDH